jgi:hypothetical protein
MELQIRRMGGCRVKYYLVKFDDTTVPVVARNERDARLIGSYYGNQWVDTVQCSDDHAPDFVTHGQTWVESTTYDHEGHATHQRCLAQDI